jgi:hypothetical protein
MTSPKLTMCKELMHGPENKFNEHKQKLISTLRIKRIQIDSKGRTNVLKNPSEENCNKELHKQHSRMLTFKHFVNTINLIEYNSSLTLDDNINSLNIYYKLYGHLK